MEVVDLVAMCGAADIQATLAGEIRASPQLPPGRLYVRCNGHAALLNTSTCAVTLLCRPPVRGVYVVHRSPAGEPVSFCPNEGEESSSRKRAAAAPPADTAAADAAAERAALQQRLRELEAEERIVAEKRAVQGRLRALDAGGPAAPAPATPSPAAAAAGGVSSSSTGAAPPA